MSIQQRLTFEGDAGRHIALLIGNCDLPECGGRVPVVEEGVRRQVSPRLFFVWHASYICTLQTLQTVESSNSTLADAVDTVLRLPSPTTKHFFRHLRWSGCMLVCSMLCVYLRYCVTCACAVDTLYM